MTAEQNYDFFAYGENEDDHIGSIYQQDVVRFMYDGKIYNGVVERDPFRGKTRQKQY